MALSLRHRIGRSLVAYSLLNFIWTHICLLRFQTPAWRNRWGMKTLRRSSSSGSGSSAWLQDAQVTPASLSVLYRSPKKKKRAAFSRRTPEKSLTRPAHPRSQRRMHTIILHRAHRDHVCRVFKGLTQQPRAFWYFYICNLSSVDWDSRVWFSTCDTEWPLMCVHAAA